MSALVWRVYCPAVAKWLGARGWVDTADAARAFGGVGYAKQAVDRNRARLGASWIGCDVELHPFQFQLTSAGPCERYTPE